MRFIINRTDSIGDAILLLPMANILRQHYPNSEVYYLGRSYVQSIIAGAKDFTGFINWDQISPDENKASWQHLANYQADVIIHARANQAVAIAAKKANIRMRIGTLHKHYHLLNCNHRINYSRRNSLLHESQLNLKLLAPLNLPTEYSIDELIKRTYFSPPQALEKRFAKLIDTSRFNLILHPGSNGSAREWSPASFLKLIDALTVENYNIFITGTEKESERFSAITEHKRVTNLIAKLDLSQLIAFVNECQGVIAASTGPLHIGAALGKPALGLYGAIPKIHPRRWGPIGKHAEFLLAEHICENCLRKKVI